MIKHFLTVGMALGTSILGNYSWAVLRLLTTTI